MGSPVIPLVRGNPRALNTATREQLAEIYQHYRAMGNEWLRRAILEHDRIDILASTILGYDVLPFHLKMLQWQFQHPDGLELIFRGAGKSTLCTIAKSIHMLLKDPNLRIVLASKTTNNSEGFLKEIKGHFEQNERLEEVFGPYYDPRRVGKWDNREIEVLPRKRYSKEASITCVGVEGTIVSKHYDVIISDDLVDEDNSRTPHMREKVKTWYYQTLDPCLEPPDPDVPHRGEHHRLGTRYHYDDLYGHLIDNELAESALIIPGLDDQDRSPWPEKYPPKWFHEKRKRAGIIIFNAQYQCDVEAMRGEVFEYDDCQEIEDKDIPKDLRIFLGADLAISTKKGRNRFAIIALGMDLADNFYILDYFTGQLRFNQQVQKFFEFYNRWDPINAAVEANAYQESLAQVIKEENREVRITPVYTHKDKMTRAWKLSALFEAKRMFFKKNSAAIIDQFVLFPNHPYNDLVDALDLAVKASKRRRRRKRRERTLGLL